MSALINLDELTRVYYIGLLAAIIAIVQIQKLYHSLIKRLVDKINELQQSLDIKDTYNASMIHELRNPLNAILGAMGLLKYSRSLSKEDHETLNIANMSGEILITLINNALDGAKIEANKLELDPHKSDIVETLTKAASLFQWKAKEKKVSLSLKIGKKIPDLVEIDEARITQILVNIIGNAVKFTPEKGNIKVRARFIQDENYRSTVDLKPIKTSSSFIEEEEFEERFFDNKELFLDMGQVSEDLVEQVEQEVKNKRKASNITMKDYDADSYTDKSQEPHTNLVVISNPLLHVNIKNDSFTSLYNVESIEERKLRSKTNLSGRELDFRNSFHEWSQFPSGPQTSQHPFRNTMKTILQQDSLDSKPLDLSNQSQIINLYQKNSSNDILNEDITNSQFCRYSDKTQLQRPIRSIHAYSENLNRDMSMMSLDSNIMMCDDKSRTRQNLTNSSSSNHLFMRRKTQEKSKFYQQNETDEQDDVSDEVNHSQSRNKQNLIQSDQNVILNLRNIEEEEYDAIDTKGCLIIEVIDSGIGISQEGIKRLFQPFQQADRSIQAKYGGTGLGLWITNKLVSLMRGKVEVKSELNKGTTFEITIPVTGEFNNNQKSNRYFFSRGEDLKNSQQTTPLKRFNTVSRVNNETTIKSDLSDQINVLLLQDDEIMSKLFKKYLQKQEIQFQFAKSFKDLHRSFKANKYRAIFIDIDVNVTVENLEHLGHYCSSLEPTDKNYFCKIYCLFSRDIDKNKAKILQKNNMKCIKKPIQGYQISKILRRLKSQNFELKKKTPHQAGQTEQTASINEESNQSPKMKRNSGQRLGSQELRDKINYDSNIGVGEFNTAAKQFNRLMIHTNQDLSDSEQKIQDDTPTPNDSNSRFFLNKENEDRKIMTQGYNRQLSNDDQRYKNTRQYQNVQKLSHGNPNVTNSSSISSSAYNYMYLQGPKINQQIEKIKQQEKKNLFNSGDSSPKALYSGQTFDFPQVKPRRTNENMETLIIKNPKLQDSPLTNYNYKTTFRINQQQHLNSDQEERKSEHFYIQTPNFNNLSIQSPSYVQSSDKQSILKEKENNTSVEENEASSLQIRNGPYSRNSNQMKSLQLSLKNDQQIPLGQQSNSVRNRTDQQQLLQLQKDTFHQLRNNLNEDERFFNNNSSNQSRHSPTKKQEPSGFNRTLPGGAVAAAQIKRQNFQNKKYTSDYQESQFNRKTQSNRRITQQSDDDDDDEEEIKEDIQQEKKHKSATVGGSVQAVMVVDDNKMNQFIVQKMLEKVPQIAKKKVEIMIADNGEEAFKKFVDHFQEGKIKLILMDCEMPILDGYEASKKIRELENTQQHSSDSQNSSQTLIIGLSGNQGEQHSRKCKLAGMNDAITKPIVFEQLNNIVKQALDPQRQNSCNSGTRRATMIKQQNTNFNNTHSSTRQYSQSVVVNNLNHEKRTVKSQDSIM